MSGIRVTLGTDSLLKYTLGLARGLLEVGVDLQLLTRDHDLEFGGEPGAMLRSVEAALDGRGEHLSLPGRVREPRHIRQALAMRRRTGSFGADVVHLQDVIVNDPGLVFAAVHSWKRLALTVHDPVERDDDPTKPVHRRSRAFLLRRARLVFVHAEVLRDQLIEATGLSAPVVVVPHGIDLPEVAPIPERPRILMFGRMHGYKGVDVLLDAMDLIWRENPAIELTIAGQGPLPSHPLLADERVTVRNRHVPEEEVGTLFAEATCVVLPYREASQSGVGSLAKHYGRPIVATDVGGLPDLVGEAGRIVAAGRADELATALLEVAGGRELAERLGRLGAASIEGTASWADVAGMTIDAYRTHLLQRRS
ncbi:MAG TPA: glycosyltransferase family 4 protein [Solirubrobacterales bacterium]|jgi:glycosyltransferase involved in cell wall biosynthesis